MLLIAPGAGCSGGSGRAAFSVRSLGEQPVVLSSRFRTRVYSHEGDRISFILSDLSTEELLSGDFDDGQVVHLELLWVPKAGNTPMDRTATNASIRHLIFIEGQLGIYGGAGFVLPRDPLGRRTVELEIREASLSLLESTEGFVDLLSPAEVMGRISADLDKDATRRLYFNVSQRVTDILGESRFVQGGRPGTDQAWMPLILTRR